MQAFDIALYALAIITVLLLRAEPTPAIEAPAPIEAPTAPEAPQTTAPAPAPAPAPAMAQAISQPVATLTIRTESSTEAPADLASILASMTSTELRKECQSAGVKWRNAHGKGRHLTKAAMVEAMVAALAA